MGRKKAKHTDTGQQARRRGGALSDAAGTLKSRARKADAEKRAEQQIERTAIAGLVEELVAEQSGDGAVKRWQRAYTRVLKSGVTLDDVAAVLLARLVLLQADADELGEKTFASQLGSINREIKDLAEAYREQGRSLPDEVAFRFVLVTGDHLPPGVVPAGEPPADAPVVEHREDVGDLLESE